ncbi:sulfurtransferase TusA family protein [Thalassotalea agarivorans]|uniref:TusA-related sulfurtransferase n=1 Tax=Thalassotalea agarivorans TaxID=349064 RepID=A0A1I0FJS4_THASX|nr:sulfurtransferase TusA family protein [Thalassotalea agarivorans]SET58320.1 TusA-related sulfurtransferase [Thalassotalea agarivorans]
MSILVWVYAMEYRYDGTQEKCPLPLVKTRVILNKMAQGDRCWVLLSDGGSKSDIPRYLKRKQIPHTITTLENNNIEIVITR